MGTWVTWSVGRPHSPTSAAGAAANSGTSLGADSRWVSMQQTLAPVMLGLAFLTSGAAQAIGNWAAAAVVAAMVRMRMDCEFTIRYKFAPGRERSRVLIFRFPQPPPRSKSSFF
jgi:hypothetical protein